MKAGGGVGRGGESRSDLSHIFIGSPGWEVTASLSCLIADSDINQWGLTFVAALLNFYRALRD